MAPTLSSRAGLLFVLLAGVAAAQPQQETARSIAVPSIAAAALPALGTTAGPAISGDINTDIGETLISANGKLTVVGGLSAELGIAAAQSGGSGALFDNGESIASGAQASLALIYGNYSLLPDSDPGVKDFLAALHQCQVPSSTSLRKKVRDLEEARARQKKKEPREGDQEKLAAAEKDGCTFGEDTAYWIVERSRFRPLLASVKATLGRSDAVFLADGTFTPVPDMVKFGVTVAVGQYLTSGMVLAGSFRWSTGNVLGGSPVQLCREVATDVLGNPVNECETGIVGSPLRGNLWRVAMELRHIVGNGLVWAPSVAVSWADGTVPTLRTQLPLLFEVLPSQDGAPIMVGLTFGFAQSVRTDPPPGSFSVAATLQSQFALGKL